AGRAEHDGVHRIVELDQPPRFGHFLAHRAVEAVECVRAVQGDDRDVIDGVEVGLDGLATHRHCQFGARFSTNAFGPSSESWVCRFRSRNASARISASFHGRARVLWRARLVPRTASGAFELTMSAISWARSSRRSWSTTSLIIPRSYA